MIDLELAYFAGLFDGEGCVQIAHHKPQAGKRTEQHTLRCAIQMTDEKSVRSFLCFGGSVCFKGYYTRNPKWKPQWTWSISSNQAKGFLEIMLPHLRLKREQAKMAIEFQEVRKHPRLINKVSSGEIAKRDWYWKKLKELKRSGND